MVDWQKVKADFPILDRQVNGHRLVYLDSAATSQKPQVVIDALADYYSSYNANIHRGVHTLSEEATVVYESVRGKVRKFIGAEEDREIVFTANTTAAINLVASSWGRQNLSAGDEIVLSAMEHHSNLVPWQMIAAERGARLVFLELTADGQIDLKQAQSVIGSKTRIVAITQMSNVLGTVVPLPELIAMAHAAGALVFVDGAQGVPHLATSVQELGCDFLAFSMHKMLGPTGVGILWGRSELLEAMPPMLGGGDMISSVWRERATYNQLPWKFEAGTPNIADVIASGHAIDYLDELGMDNVRRHEIDLTKYAMERLSALPGITIYGPPQAESRGGVLSFNFKGVHPHDLGQIVNEYGVAIRVGHHCCQPLMRDLDVTGTARASFYIYNTKADVDALVDALIRADEVLGRVAYR